MTITCREKNDWKEIPVATSFSFDRYWRPAAKELNLEMIDALGGLWLTAPFRDRFLDELGKLKDWAKNRDADDPYLPEMMRRIDEIADAVRSHSLADCEIAFG